MLGAMDTLKQENDLFSSGLHNEDELLYEPEVEDCEILTDDAQPLPPYSTQNSNL